ncbi:MAG: DegV family protein [Actinomycetota bacterium]
MGKIAIITDSSSDIPQDMAARYGITVMPMYISFGGKTYKEGEDITNQQVYQALESGLKIHTSGPSVGDFTKAYSEALNRGGIEKIYSINLSSKLSSTINSAMIAKRNFPDEKIKVIDPKNVTISLGLIVLEAAKLAHMGVGEEKVDQAIAFLIEKTSFFAAIENFKYVLRSGRTPFLGNLLSKALIFKPVVSVNSSGKIYLKRLLKNKNNAIEELHKQTIRHLSGNFNWNIGIFYGQEKERALYLKKVFESQKKLPIKNIILSEITTVISAHTGPGIWGVAYGPSIDM